MELDKILLWIVSAAGLCYTIYSNTKKDKDAKTKENDAKTKEIEVHESVITVKRIDSDEKFRADLISQVEKLTAAKDALEEKLTLKIDALQQTVDTMRGEKSAHLEIESNLKRQNYLLGQQIRTMQESHDDQILQFQRSNMKNVLDHESLLSAKDKELREMQSKFQTMELEIVNLRQILDDNGLTANN